MDSNTNSNTDALCTYTDTRCEYKKQYWRQCMTCHNQNQGACLSCCAVCHNGSGHNLGPIRYGSFYCDCPELGKCKICDLSKLPPSSSYTPVDLMDVDSDAVAGAPVPRPVLDTTISKGINTGAIKFFETMEPEKVYSPLSITVAMGLVHLGARTQTEYELTSFFDTKYSIEDIIKLHTYFNGDIVKMSNVLFLNRDTASVINPDYTLSISEVALCRTEDFTKSKVISDTINNYISDNTNGLIKDVIKPDLINPFCVAILVNTVYFKCNWLHPFNKRFTDPNANFTSELSGAQLKVPLMDITTSLKYHSSYNYHMVEIPYANREYVMGVALAKNLSLITSPAVRANVLRDLSQPLDAYYKEVNLFLPKFTQRKNCELVPQFKKHGVTTLFDKNTADLSGISSSVYVSDIIHEAIVIVDEEGTEAAATTVVGIRSKSCIAKPPQPVLFRADKSFIYYIKHTPTNTLLFVGEYHGTK